MRQKSLYIEIWRDHEFSELSQEAKLLALYCLTNPNIRLVPSFKLTDREIVFDTGLKNNKLQKLKKELEKLNIFFLENYCVIKSKYGAFNFKGKKLESAISREKNQLPEKVIQVLESDTLSIPYRYPIDRVNSNSNSNSNSNKVEILKKEDIELKEKRFKKPTIEEIKKYCIERKNNLDSDKFYDYYESKGWLVGKSKMKDWKAAVRNWERNSFRNLSKKKFQAETSKPYEGIF